MTPLIVIARHTVPKQSHRYLPRDCHASLAMTGEGWQWHERAGNGIKELAIWKLVNLYLIRLSSLGVCRVLGLASRELKPKKVI